jgi:hypothetical protein
LKQCLQTAFIRNVCRDGDGFASNLSNFISCGLNEFSAASGWDYVSASSRQPFRERQSNTRGSADYYGGF